MKRSLKRSLVPLGRMFIVLAFSAMIWRWWTDRHTIVVFSEPEDFGVLLATPECHGLHFTHPLPFTQLPNTAPTLPVPEPATVIEIMHFSATGYYYVPVGHGDMVFRGDDLPAITANLCRALREKGWR